MITTHTKITLTWTLALMCQVALWAQPSPDEIYYTRCQYNGASCDLFLEKINRLTCDTTRVMQLDHGIILFAPDGKLYNIDFIPQERIDIYEVDISTQTTHYRFSNYSILTPTFGLKTIVTNEWECYMLTNNYGLIRFQWPNGNMEVIPEASFPNPHFESIEASQHEPDVLYGNIYNQGLRRFDLTTRTLSPVLVADPLFFDSRALGSLLWLPNSCGGSNLYGTSRVAFNTPLVNTDSLITYAPLTFQTQVVCPTDHKVEQISSPYSNQPFNCAFSLDLDVTASGSGYTDTLCLGGTAAMTGPGGCTVIAESSRIDSAAVWLVSGPGSLGVGLAGVLPAPLALQSAADRWTFSGLGDGAVYGTALDALRFTASAAGSYTLAVAAFDRAYGRTDTVEVRFYFAEPLAHAGQDSALVLCSRLGGAQALLPLLGPQAQPGGSWSPALGAGADLFTPGLDEPGPYRYIVAGQYGCPADTAWVTVSVSNLPEPFSLGSDTLLCGDQTLSLSLPTGSWQAIWADGHATSDRIVDAPGVYAATLTDLLGCSRAADLTVSVAPADTLWVSAAVCAGLAYVWEGQTLMSSGRYCVNFSSATGCDSVRCLELSRLPLPEIELPEQAYFCPGEMVLLSASSPGATFIWSTGETTPDIAVARAGVYTVTATHAAGCMNSAQVVVAEAALTRAFERINPGCAGVEDGLIMPALPLPPDWAPYRWTLNGEDVDWATGAVGLPAGQYLSALTDSRGCTFRDTLLLESPIAWTLALTPDQTILAGDTVVLSAEAIPPLNLRYQWIPAVRLSCDTCTEVRAWPDLSQSYQLLATDEAGCERRGQVWVRVLPRPRNYYAPTAFSPNDDGVNDRWRLYGEQGEYTVSSLQVYNRWGGLVYEISDADPAQSDWGWSGSAKGQACASGVYLYRALLRFRDGEEIEASGEIHLVR